MSVDEAFLAVLRDYSVRSLGDGIAVTVARLRRQVSTPTITDIRSEDARDAAGTAAAN